MNLTPEQMHKYFELRLGHEVAADRNILVRCPFHQDSNPSMSLYANKGVWNCKAGCGSGGFLAFEQKFSSCDKDQAWANIAELLNLSRPITSADKPQAVYVYTDLMGKELFQKVRYPNGPDGKKNMKVQHPDGNGGYRLGKGDAPAVLYNLPDVITANCVFITEGEKDADNAKAALRDLLPGMWANIRPAFTTNHDGAGRWRDDCSKLLAGKYVVIFQDNDKQGRDHAQAVANSVFPYAAEVRIIDLPGLPEKGDVSDFLKTHPAEELLTIVRNTPVWKPSVPELLISAPDFLSAASVDIEWMVENVIQRGSNGFMCAFPKVGKSWAAADLALALALGLPWLGFNVPRPVRTALISREDYPGLTRWRMDHLLRGRGRERHELQGKLFINTKEQSPEFRLDKSDLLGPMLQALKEIQPEFAILDVFNILHSKDENDNTEMREVMEQLNVIYREVGCAIGVLHHFNKTAEGSLTQRIRGAGAIAGWAEWAIGIEMQPKEKYIRRMEFELKAGQSPDPVFYEIKSDEIEGLSVIERVDRADSKERPASRLDSFIQ